MQSKSTLTPITSSDPNYVEAAAEHFGWFALFAGMDVPAASERTRALLGWVPKQRGLLADLDQPGYFAG